MKKLVCIYFFLCLVSIPAIAQLKDSSGQSNVKVKSKAVSLGISIPFGEFPESHSFGIGAEFAWSNHRLGLMTKKPVKPVGFIANGGIDYYFGRNRTVSIYQYKYGNFTYIHAFGGAIYNPCKRGNIQLTGGPALGMENGIVEFWWGINLSGGYYVNEKIAITPGIIFMKQSIADPLLAATVRAILAF